EERACGIGGDKNPRAAQFDPGERLAAEEDNAERGPDGPPRVETLPVPVLEGAPGQLQRNARCQQNRGVDPEDARLVNSDPIIGHAAAYHHGAGESREDHCGRRENYVEPGERRASRRAAAIAATAFAPTSLDWRRRRSAERIPR